MKSVFKTWIPAYAGMTEKHPPAESANVIPVKTGTQTRCSPGLLPWKPAGIPIKLDSVT